MQPFFSQDAKVQTPNCSAWFPLGKALTDFNHGHSQGKLLTKSDIEGDRFVSVASFYTGPSQFTPLSLAMIKSCVGIVADLGAGSGSHSLFLQSKGYKVYGFDISFDCVEVMKARGVKNASQIDIMKEPLPQKFDSILICMNGLGIAGSIKGLDTLLFHLTESLNDGGRIICDSTDISYVKSMPAQKTTLPRLKNKNLGEVNYQMIYEDYIGEIFPWLYIDDKTLRKTCSNFQLKMLPIAREDESTAYIITKEK
ncbi:MAG: class I SAM-dependent methyltransferase [Bacteroidota bacterium]|nr:class I SAM-dependent methyltransferase [Bacteroidota bacterium]